MKKIIALTALCIGCLLPAAAQKFAMVDMEYIMSNIPAYERANEQLNQTSKKWQAEVEALDNQAKTLYKNYQNEAVFLSEAQKKEREQAIVDKEKEASELRKKYFGPQGELYKKQQSLIKPIQDDIYAACKKVCEEKGYQVIFDRASIQGAMYVSPRIDVTDEVIAKLGY